MRLYILLVIIAAVASVGLAFTYFVSQAKADRYLAIAYFPPHLAGNIDKALEEVKREAQWASWFGDVGLALKRQRDVINKILEEWGIGRDGASLTVVNERGERQKITYPFAYRIYKRDGKIVAEIRQKGRVVFNYTTVDLEDVFWTLMEKGRELNDTTLEHALLSFLIAYKFDLPLDYFVFAIPFCNGTYYGPDVKPLRAVIDGRV